MIPNSWYLTGGGVVLAFFMGAAAGNLHATRRMVDTIQARADAQFEAATRALAEENKRRDAVAKARGAALAVAELDAHRALVQGADAAEAARAAALAQLARERTKLKQLGDSYAAALDTMELDRCRWSADARRLLDAAAGSLAAARAGTGPDPVTAPASGTSGTVTAAAAPAVGRCLSEADLFRGYAALGAWARRAAAKDQAWREWAAQALRTAP